jgi:benzoate/toluate 1,2-dioxygenase reductase component
MAESSHEVVLRYADGVERSIRVGTGESVLGAALAADVPLLHQCRSGSCSTCVASLAKGDAPARRGASTSLLPRDYAAGQRLLCVCEAHTDCVFDLPYGSTVASDEAVEAHAFVNAVERIAPNVVRLSLELAEGSWLSFRPGQYVQIEVPGAGVMRSYSPATIATKLPGLELLVRLVPGGAMSSWLESHARPDDVVTLRGPYGGFYLREKQRVPHIFVAGGTGLAPIMAMIDGIRGAGGQRPPMLLSFGCATPDTLFYLDDIALREQWLPSLRTRICVDQGAYGTLHGGNPVSAISQADVTDARTVAYLCGPQPMIASATERLIGFGVAPENIFSEQFVASH